MELGLPCPTTIFTFGMLLLADRKLSFGILIIPLLWSVIGLSAAISLGMYEDIGLIVSAVAVVLLQLRRSKDKETGEIVSPQRI